MNNDMLLWIAQQIGINIGFSESEIIAWWYGPSYVFDLTANTPQAAYDQEKVLQWLGEQHLITIACQADKHWYPLPNYTGKDAEEMRDWFIYHTAAYPATRAQALLTACEYVWRKEVGDVAKA